jgi:hypothetical protein
MKKLAILVSMAMLGMTVHAKSHGDTTPLTAKKTSSLTGSYEKKPVKHIKKFANSTLTLSRGSSVNGNYIIQLSGPSGNYQFPFTNGATYTIAQGTYGVGIGPAGGGTTSYSISGSVCTVNYSVFAPSATFSNVPFTCSSGTFSIN